MAQPPILLLKGPLQFQGFPKPYPAPFRTIAPPANALVWNAATSDANFSYSYDRLTAGLSSTPSGSDHLVRASASNTSGYFEILVVALGSGMAIGLTSSGAATNDFVGDANGVGWRQDGSVTRSAANLAVYSGYGAGDILGFCRKGNFLYLSRNGTWQGSADPSAGTGGLDVSAFPSELLFPAASATSSTLSITGRFTASSFSYAVPTGVSAWDVLVTNIPTTVTVTAASLIYIGQAIVVNAKTVKPVTAAGLTYAGQVIAVNAKKFITVTAASLIYLGQAITVNAKKTIAVTAAALTYTGQLVVVNAKKVVAVTAASLVYAGQSITTNAKKFVVVTAASLAYSGKTITINASRLISVTAAGLAYSGKTIAINAKKVVAVSAASLTYAGGLVVVSVLFVATPQKWRRLCIRLGIGL